MNKDTEFSLSLGFGKSNFVEMQKPLLHVIHSQKISCLIGRRYVLHRTRFVHNMQTLRRAFRYNLMSCHKSDNFQRRFLFQCGEVAESCHQFYSLYFYFSRPCNLTYVTCVKQILYLSVFFFILPKRTCIQFLINVCYLVA